MALRQQVSHQLRDAKLTGSAMEQRILMGTADALNDRSLQTEIDLDRLILQPLAARQFSRSIPLDTMRKVMAGHGPRSRDTYPVVARDWQLVPVIVREGTRYIERRRDGSLSLIHVWRAGDLDYVYVERIGMKRALRLRAKSFFKTRRYQPNESAEPMQ